MSSPDRTVVRAGRNSLRLGFVPLLDAAPLLVADALGYFADESLSVVLERQIGWGNVRDKLTFGQLDASHALAGMPIASQLAWDSFSEPLVALMTIATGGDAITLARPLVERGITTATALAGLVRSQAEGARVRLAHVFACSMHHYLLRAWLESGGIDPERDVELSVVPPGQTLWQMEQGCLEGFCVGEPWNTAAERAGHGVVVAATADLLPDHPEKVLAVTRRWLRDNEPAAERLVRAVLRGCAYCHDRRNHGKLAEVLSRKTYLGLPAEVISASLAFAGPTHPKVSGGTVRANRWRARSFDPAAAYPSATHMAWILDRMVHVGQAAAPEDPLAMARRACESGPYRHAARAIGIEPPPHDFPPMQLRAGIYDPFGRQRDGRQAETSARS